jgi:D-sedoheptulose 7-phosphate isomerase
MQREIYKASYEEFFRREDLGELLDSSKKLVKKAERIFFIGNGGSNSIASHMMEDFGKMLRKKTFAFSDPSLITCYANDYGYERAFAEWLKLYEPSTSDLLVAISSSGTSRNIINATQQAIDFSCPIITLSGFGESNPLSSMGTINLHVNSSSYGIVETIHQLFIHMVLDECDAEN